MDHCTDVSDSEIIYDVVFSGFNIHFDLSEASDIRKRLPVVRKLVFSCGNQALSCQSGDRSFGVFIYVFRRLMAVIDSAEFDGLLRSLRQSHAPAAAFWRHALIRNYVIFRFTAEGLGRNLLKFALRIQGRSLCRAGHRMSGLAATRDAGPRQVLRSISPGDIAFLPRHTEHLRNYTVNVAQRSSSQVANPRLNGDAAIRPDHE